MIMLLKFIYESVVTKKIDRATISEQLDATLAESKIEQRDHKFVSHIETEPNSDAIPIGNCIKGKGKVTSLNSEMVMIDNKYEYKLRIGSNIQLRLNETVSYFLFKDTNDQLKIVKIEQINDDQWDEEEVKEGLKDLKLERPEVFSTHRVIKMGVVIKKWVGIVVVNVDGDEVIDIFLDDVQTEFKQRVGDQVSLTTIVETDPRILTECGRSIKVEKIEATIYKDITGLVTFIKDSEYGIIDQKYFFFWDALDENYRTVNKNDKVRAKCIECEPVNRNCRYRCLKVYLEETAVVHIMENVDQNRQRWQTTNKNGVEVQDNISVELTDINETKEFTIMVKNISDRPRKVLCSLFIGRMSESQLTLISPSRDASFTLQPDEEKQYLFKAKSKYFGSAREKFSIKFERINSDSCDFRIDRFIEVNVEDTKQLHPSIGTGKNIHKNRTYTKNVLLEDRHYVIPGEPIKKSPNFVKIRFQHYEFPRTLSNVVLGNSTRSSINEDLDSAYPFLKQSLNLSRYACAFHHLIYLEEIEIYHGMRKYDREKVHFTREGEFLALTVLNIADRPSLVIGDSVIITCPWKDDKKNSYCGIIHKVLNNRILLKFDGNFHASYNCENYKIVFEFSRSSIKKQHHAIDLVSRRTKFAENVLFPNRVLIKPSQLNVILNRNDGELYLAEEHIPWFNKSLNIVQKEAIANILQGVARPMPYVIFGPPGTGKTITLIETILQLVKRTKGSRIMVAAPSNSSANLITERIMESGILERGDFIRLVGENALEKEQIPENILPYCGTIDIARKGTTKEENKVTESGLKINCDSKYLMQRRILIGTCITLGTLMQCDIPEDHFTHVIIDESGQCLESEIIIPMSFADKDQGQIILAGDPMQLGPIVLSRYAEDRGLAKSFLVRLLDQRPYLFDEEYENGYDPRLTTRLVYNYRALPSIMSVYSSLFYDNALKSMINDTDSEESKILAKAALILPNYGDRDIKEVVIFIGVEGKNQQCADSPSWMNMSESKSVFRFLIRLYQEGFDAKDIGIITPYMQQVKAIRTLINEAEICMPKIGTVEEFQVQERQIILLSTVRSTYRQMQNDCAHSLGFVRSPKWMNVAISRARALLVIFGSPTLLTRDENWKVLITKCVEKKCSDNCNLCILNLNQNSDEKDE